MFELKITNPFVESADKKGVYSPIEGADGRWVHDKGRVTVSVMAATAAECDAVQFPAETTREKLLKQAGSQQLTLDEAPRWYKHSDRSYDPKGEKAAIRYVEYRPSRTQMVEALCL